MKSILNPRWSSHLDRLPSAGWSHRLCHYKTSMSIAGTRYGMPDNPMTNRPLRQPFCQLTRRRESALSHVCAIRLAWLNGFGWWPVAPGCQWFRVTWHHICSRVYAGSLVGETFAFLPDLRLKTLPQLWQMLSISANRALGQCRTRLCCFEQQKCF